MQIRNLSTAVFAAGAMAITSYDIETVTNQHTTDVTITSCADNKCESTVDATSLTTVTTTIDGIETVYTTVCPESSSSTLAPEASTEEKSVTSTVTATVSGEITIYTTVCPETEAEASTEAVLPESSEAKGVPSSAVEDIASSEEITYVDVTVTPTVTASTGVEATVTAQSSFTSIYNSNSSAADVSTFEGAAASNQIRAGFVALAAVALAV